MHVWKVEEQKWRQESSETARHKDENPNFQQSIPKMKNFELYFKKENESSLYEVRNIADAKYIMKIVNDPAVLNSMKSRRQHPHNDENRPFE